MEELDLTTPVVTPPIDKFHVVTLLLDMESQVLPGTIPGLVAISLKDNNNRLFNYRYEGQIAIDMIKFLNTANLTTKSMHKRILERLSNDGVLPGSVVGTPDPAASVEL